MLTEGHVNTMNESVAGHDASLDNVKGITTFAMKIVALMLVMLGSFSTAVLLPGIGDLATRIWAR